MFESALEQNTPRRRLGRGAMLSIVAHAVLIGLALYISSRPSAHASEKVRSVTFFAPPPPPPPPPPPAGGGAQPKKVEPKKVVKKPDTIVKAKKIEEVPQKQPDPPKETPAEPGGQAGGVPGGVAGGVPGGVVGGTVGGVPGGTGNSNEVMPFGAGMVKPGISRAPEIVPSKEALAMKVGGLALVKCVVNLDGTVTDCRLMKGLQYMDQQILQGARAMRFSGPVMYQGHPQRVEMIIPIRVPTPS